MLTYIDGEGKSGASYAALYAEENGIAAQCVMGQSDFRAQYASHSAKYGKIAAVIIMDDIAATGLSLVNNIDQFIGKFNDLVSKIKVRVITLVATRIAQETVLKRLNEIDGVDIEFRTCEILSEKVYAFPEGSRVWRSEDEGARARGLCIDLGS